jgi:hypothetical protein
MIDMYPVLEHTPIGDLIEFHSQKQQIAVFNMSRFVRRDGGVTVIRYMIDKMGDWENLSQTKLDFNGYPSANEAVAVFYQGGIKKSQNELLINRYMDLKVSLYCQNEAIQDPSLVVMNINWIKQWTTPVTPPAN